jgi:Cu/Zn superoxide dismutase
MQRPAIVCALAACVALAAACDSSTDVTPPVTYRATLNAASEVPPTTSNGTGIFSAQLLPDSTLSYSLTWSGLTGTSNGAHIHGPGNATQIAGILVDFAATPAGTTNATITQGASGSASGNLNLKLAITATVSGDSLLKLLDLGLLYVNVHTVANSGGEIRGQISRQ